MITSVVEKTASTVKELKAILNKCSDDAEIFFENDYSMTIFDEENRLEIGVYNS